jgi:hypothetical protein
LFPSFEIPKKNGTIRVVTDFRKLNLLLNYPSHPFPIPKTGKSDMIRSMEGFTFASALDLNMGAAIISNLIMMLMLKSYVPLYSHGKNTNTNA